MEYESIEERIRKLQESLDGSYKALSERLARLENKNFPEETVQVTFSKREAEELYGFLKKYPGVWRNLYAQELKLGYALGVLRL